MRSIIKLTLALGLFLALGAAGKASAQMNNQPYTPRFQGGGVGMSAAYKEAILRKEFFGETPRNLARSPSGDTLLRVERRGNQAFLRTYDTSFVPVRARNNSLGGPSLSYGLSIAGLFAGVGDASIWMVTMENNGIPWSGLAGGGRGDTPINSWISQLEAFPRS